MRIMTAASWHFWENLVHNPFKYFLVIVLMLYCRFSWADMRVYDFVMRLSNMAIEFSPRSGNRHGGAKWNLIAHV